MPVSDFLDGYPLSVRIMKVINAASDNGGLCTKAFNQEGKAARGKGEELGFADWYRSEVYPDGRPVKGVCLALSTYWIIYHAAGYNFWEWLIKDDARVRLRAARKVVKAQLEAHGQQYAWERQMMAASGFKYKNGGRLAREYKNLTPEGRGRELADLIAPEDPNGYGFYRSIGIFGHNAMFGGNVAHAMAAWVGKDVAFFDPLYGEFWFENRKNFRWFFYRYWTLVGGSYTGFEVCCYGKDVRKYPSG
jgi:hypothetical protein